MESVDALRNWADGLSGIWIDPNDHSIIVTTCDDMPPSIDCVNLREHVNGILDGIEREVAEHYALLPVDADGEPIHIGDVMEWSDGKTFEVVGIGDTGTLYYLDTYDDGTVVVEWTAAGDKRHHHAPTVEDILREFTRDWCNAACAGDMTNAERDAARADTIAEYAAKLRLAEGVDE